MAGSDLGPVGAAYAGCRERIGALVTALDDCTASSTRVPACPEWSVHDVVAHLAGVVDDAIAGRLDGVATGPWTAAQVEARRNTPVADIVAEWNEKASAFESLLDAIGDPGRQAVLDVVSHEHDVRGALGAAGARDEEAVRIALSFIAPSYTMSAAANGAAIRVVSSDGSAFGPEPGEADATLTADPFDLVRSLTGRRSLDQVRSLHWEGDVERGLAALTFGPFAPATEPHDA